MVFLEAHQKIVVVVDISQQLENFFLGEKFNFNNASELCDSLLHRLKMKIISPGLNLTILRNARSVGSFEN